MQNNQQQPIDEPLEAIKERLRRAMTEVTDYFMTKPDRGNQIPMPTDIITTQLAELERDVKLYGNGNRSDELAMVDNRLKDEFGEDWLSYRDVRQNELSLEQAELYDSIPTSRVS